jgi:hypothetical protein
MQARRISPKSSLQEDARERLARLERERAYLYAMFPELLPRRDRTLNLRSHPERTARERKKPCW